MASSITSNGVDDGIHVGNVDLAIAVRVAQEGPTVPIRVRHPGVTAIATVDNDNDHVIGIGNGDLAVTVDVARDSELNALNLVELLPAAVVPIVLQ